VQLEGVTTDDVDPDTVVDIAPLSARLEAGQTVLVSYAVAPERRTSTYRSPRSATEAAVQPPGRATSTPAHTPTVAAPPTPTTTHTSTTTSTPTLTVPSQPDENGGGGQGDGDDPTDGTGDRTGTPTESSTPATSTADNQR
jgi:serine/threonine-protein kinase